MGLCAAIKRRLTGGEQLISRHTWIIIAEDDAQEMHRPTNVGSLLDKKIGKGAGNMSSHVGSARERAMRTLVAILGGGNVALVDHGPRHPPGLKMEGRPLIVIAGDQGEPLAKQSVRAIAIAEGCDVVGTYVDEFRSGHQFVFDIVRRCDTGMTMHDGYRYCVIDGQPPTFVPGEGNGDAQTLRIVDGRLQLDGERSRLTKEQRMIGLVHGQAQLQLAIQIAPPSDRDIGHGTPMHAHPAKLIIVFPMYEAADCRQRLAAIDDALVVHRRGDGRFEFELRPMVELGPRNSAEWVIGLAADLEAGHVVMIVDRDAFLADIEKLAREHVGGRQRAALEHAIVVIAERTRYQVQDHLDTDDDEARSGRRLIARRPRRTKAKPGERSGLNCIAGIPTPRAEQLWNSLSSEWCDVRTAQHARAAWESWAQRNRPGMPTADA